MRNHCLWKYAIIRNEYCSCHILRHMFVEHKEILFFTEMKITSAVRPTSAPTVHLKNDQDQNGICYCNELFVGHHKF